MSTIAQVTYAVNTWKIRLYLPLWQVSSLYCHWCWNANQTKQHFLTQVTAMLYLSIYCVRLKNKSLLTVDFFSLSFIFNKTITPIYSPCKQQDINSILNHQGRILAMFFQAAVHSSSFCRLLSSDLKNKLWQKWHKMNKVIHKTNQPFTFVYLDDRDVISFASDP